MGTKKSKGRSRLSPLDELYTTILSGVHDQPALLKILAVIGDSDFLQMRIGHIEHLLELEPGDVRLTLRGLNSVIGARLIFRTEASDYNDWSFGSRIVVHHANFYDFLSDPERAGVFHVENSYRANFFNRVLVACSYNKPLARKPRDFVAWYNRTMLNSFY
jgi:hypothetical protein